MKYRFYLIFAFSFALISCNKYLTNIDTFRPESNGIMKGYLDFRDLPNSIVLLPGPPTQGTAAHQADIDGLNALLNQSDSARKVKAAQDAPFDFPDIFSTYSEIVGIEINDTNTPYLSLVLKRVLSDAATSTYLAKKHYKRQRPFMINNQPFCTPEMKEHLEKDGSYPSGHAAIGWTWALILSEVFPEHTNKLILRGKEFGESRVVCNLHWPSDVEAGRFMGSATVARLHGNKNFMADLNKAKEEIAALKKQP